MADVEVHLDWQGVTRRVGLMRRHGARHRETVTFEYDPQWLESGVNFTVDPSMPMTAGVFRPNPGHEIFGTIGDSSPDTWGRTLMRRRERRAAEQENRAVRTLQEVDFLLGVSDETRLGALRFRWVDDSVFQAPAATAVPTTIHLGQLLAASKRILRGDESDDDLLLAIALDLAALAGISTAKHQLLDVGEQAVFISERFDRVSRDRIPFVSAMSMTQHRHGERGSYLELVDAITSQGADADADRRELYRRVVFSVLISNTDDHLRNHGFLWAGEQGWVLSPAYDLNPTPADMKPRVLATSIDYDDSTCSLDLVRSVASEFSLKQAEADAIIFEVANATKTWRKISKHRGANASEIDRMQSAFEHEDLTLALKLDRI